MLDLNFEKADGLGIKYFTFPKFTSFKIGTLVPFKEKYKPPGPGLKILTR